ncbi:lambda-exonuclease family protein [Polaromonas sp.]|uniref:lambda-exonuclease family protein n=1 Tax=Polaromonas sp. TaxID=1869339 RepID=UPI0032658EBE
MNIVPFLQGTPEWLAHRATHFNASDAPAMMGCSPYKTRSQLLHEMHTGLAPEVDASTQRRYADGHRFEALARPLAEKIIGEDLYPVVGSSGKLSASFDGLNMDESIAFEHKTMNAALYGDGAPWGSDFEIPLQYRVQMEQQLMVSGAEKVLFMASRWDGDELDVEQHCWYTSDDKLRETIERGWEQLAIDLAAYVPPAAAPVVVAAAVTALPAVTVQVAGQITVTDNFKAFEVALFDFIEHRLIRTPKTDQDFADLDQQIKALKGAEAALDSAEAQMLAQLATVDGAKRTKDMLHKMARDNRLMAEKLLTTEKERRRGEIVAGGVTAFRTHMDSLNTRLGKPYMPAVAADFGGVIKGKKNLDSMEDAVSTELARAKGEANSMADKIQINLGALRELAAAHAFLFADTGAIVLKAPDDCRALIENRIAAHKVEEQRKEDAQRERIRAEEQAKAEKAVRDQIESDARIAREAAAAAATAVPPVALAQVEAYCCEKGQAQGLIGAVCSDCAETSTAYQEAMFAPRQEHTANVVTLAAARPTPAPATPPTTPPTLKLGEISTRLGFAVTADFLRPLGFDHVKERGACLFHESSYPLMLAALVQHLEQLQAKQAA